MYNLKQNESELPEEEIVFRKLIRMIQSCINNDQLDCTRRYFDEFKRVYEPTEHRNNVFVATFETQKLKILTESATYN